MKSKNDSTKGNSKKSHSNHFEALEIDEKEFNPPNRKSIFEEIEMKIKEIVDNPDKVSDELTSEYTTSEIYSKD